MINYNNLAKQIKTTGQMLEKQVWRNKLALEYRQNKPKEVTNKKKKNLDNVVLNKFKFCTKLKLTNNLQIKQKSHA